MTTINQLPDELLDGILRMVVCDDTCLYSYQTNQAPPSVFLVCWRCHRLAKPHLYREIFVNDDNGARVLHRNCKQNPALPPLVRNLSIMFTSPADIVADLITWCTSTKALTIALEDFMLPYIGDSQSHSDDPERTWRHLHLAVLHLPFIEELGLMIPKWGFGLNIQPPVVSAIRNFEKLRLLRLIGARVNDKTLKDKARTAHFTELELDLFSHTHDALADLVGWPAKLEVFSMQYLSFDFEAYAEVNWNLGKLCSILSTHQTTLRAIHIRYAIVAEIFFIDPYYPSNRGFDLRPFSNLTHLTLSRRTTGTSPHLAPRLLAPRLRVFCWDLVACNNRHQQDPDWRLDLTADEEKFLHTLARKADAQRAALELVKIDYMPPGEIVLENKDNGVNDGAGIGADGGNGGDNATHPDISPWHSVIGVAFEMRCAKIAFWWDNICLTSYPEASRPFLF